VNAPRPTVAPKFGESIRSYFTVVLGHGKPFFAGPRPPLRLEAHDRIAEDVIRLAYVPA
jgi:hypothetical protein